jgi:hypothetical protein
VFQDEVSLEASLMFGPVGTESADELWLDPALVALMALKGAQPRVGLPAPLAAVSP